jgi:hypothetical protein
LRAGEDLRFRVVAVFGRELPLLTLADREVVRLLLPDLLASIENLSRVADPSIV